MAMLHHRLPQELYCLVPHARRGRDRNDGLRGMVDFLWCVGSVIFGIAGVIGLVDMAWERWGF
jgi:hypothetical protein